MGEVFFRGGHVDVIAEEHHFLAGLGRTQQSLLPLLELVLIHENVQDVTTLGLGGEVKGGGDELVGLLLLEQVIGHNDRFACTCLSVEEHTAAAHDEFVSNVLEFDRIGGGHQNVEVGLFGVILPVRHQFIPALELPLLEIDEVIVDLALEGEPRKEFQDLALEMLGELDSAVVAGVVVQVGPSRPDEGEHEDHAHQVLSLGGRKGMGRRVGLFIV